MNDVRNEQGRGGDPRPRRLYGKGHILKVATSTRIVPEPQASARVNMPLSRFNRFAAKHGLSLWHDENGARLRSLDEVDRAARWDGIPRQLDLFEEGTL